MDTETEKVFAISRLPSAAYENETETKGKRTRKPNFTFFVYCHIVWRLQLLDDLHLVGLALHDAKVTKQLWKERSCE